MDENPKVQTYKSQAAPAVETAAVPEIDSPIRERK
jgi:hypothetical protein